jgi:hypothetical protein
MARMTTPGAAGRRAATGPAAADPVVEDPVVAGSAVGAATSAPSDLLNDPFTI